MFLFLPAVPSPVTGENVEVVIRLGGHVGVTFMFLVQYMIMKYTRGMREVSPVSFHFCVLYREMIAQDVMWMTILCISSLHNHISTNVHTV